MNIQNRIASKRKLCQKRKREGKSCASPLRKKDKQTCKGHTCIITKTRSNWKWQTNRRRGTELKAIFNHRKKRVAPSVREAHYPLQCKVIITKSTRQVQAITQPGGEKSFNRLGIRLLVRFQVGEVRWISSSSTRQLLCQCYSHLKTQVYSELGDHLLSLGKWRVEKCTEVRGQNFAFHDYLLNRFLEVIFNRKLWSQALSNEWSW